MRLSNDPVLDRVPDRNVKSPNMGITRRLPNKAVNHRIVSVIPWKAIKHTVEHSCEREMTEILKYMIVVIPPGGSLGTSASARASRAGAKVWLKVFTSPPPVCVRSSNFFKQQVGFECPHHPNCIHTRVKVSLVGPRHLSKCCGKKPKAMTMVTLMSHQQIQQAPFYGKISTP